jgi:CheY-like chemotaxis protein
LEAARKSKVVAVVDDSPIAVMHLSLLLRKMGFRVIAARDGIEALRVIQSERPDIILLDLNMPVMDGVAVLSALKESINLEATPVIVVTVESDPRVRAKCFALGCRGYLQKPVALSDLHEQMQACIQPQSGRRANLRAPFGKKVRVAAPGHVGEHHAVTLSEGGIYVRMSDRPPIGTPVAVTLCLDSDQPVTLQGTVLYQKDVFGQEITIDPGVAIRFSDLTPVQSARLAAAVRRSLMADLLEDLNASAPLIAEDAEHAGPTRPHRDKPRQP